MRKFLFVLSAAVLMLCGCDKENDVLFINEYGFGTMVTSGVIQSDGGLKYNITKNEANAELQAGKRVLYVCDILKRISDSEFNINLKQLSYPLSKKPVTPAEVDSSKDEFKADNPANVDMAWFAGGYLNLRVNLFISKDADKRKTHYLNLVLDKEKKTVTLMHNADGEYYGEGGMELEDLMLAQTYACFESTDFDTSYTLHWKWHATNDDTGDITPASGDCSYKFQ
ncbi:MAG: hypothetical protein IKR69_03480 [Bacteroidales bacterium]|nr:hypothetical protein [Bacteroidales bacterium]